MLFILPGLKVHEIELCTKVWPHHLNVSDEREERETLYRELITHETYHEKLITGEMKHTLTLISYSTFHTTLKAALRLLYLPLLQRPELLSRGPISLPVE